MKKYYKLITVLLTLGLLLNIFGFNMQINVYADSNVVEKSTYSGFELTSKKYLEDIQATIMEFKHIKTEAKLVFLQNNDDNKVFSITFKTLPTDDTGVNHIIEHSVLCGSKNYPVKDPFLLMNKQSLKTFLNAFTASDFTMYPVSSKNEKDLYNLMGVYLDAVFYPNIYKEPKIFKQEGWHYELLSRDGELTYNGIVYNEMKGNYSSADRILNNEINKSLFPESVYKNESGGHPDYIPTLTYENFINTHKKNYNPSNSMIYLYGNLDIEKALKFIDEKYLSTFDKINIDNNIPVQKPFSKKVERVMEYDVEKNSKIKDMTYIASNYVIGKVTDSETTMGMAILNDLLLGSPSSPLKKALEESKIGVNYYGSYDSNCLQPVFSIVAENANENDKVKFEKIIQDTLNKIAKEGFNKDLMESTFNAYEIDIRSLNNSKSKGMAYNNAVASDFIYGQDLTNSLKLDSQIKEIKNKINNKYFENLIEKYLLNNNHSSLVILKPKPGLEAQKSLELKRKLADYKSKLSKEQIDTLIKETKELKEWQDKPDSKENLGTIPTLTKNDINPKVEAISTVEKNENGIKILSHLLTTNGISYANLYFDSSKVPQDKLLYLNLLSSVLGDMDTNKHNYRSLSDEISKYTGGISFNATAFSREDTIYPKMIVSMSALNEKLPKGFELVDEIINNSKFTDKKHVHELIQQMRADFENGVSEEGVGIAIGQVNSYISDLGRYDNLGGIPFYNFITDLDKNFDKKYPEIVKNLEDVNKLVFNKDNLLVSYTGDEKNYNTFKDSFNKFATNIKDEKFQSQTYKFDNTVKNEGLIIPSKVQYVVKGGSLQKAGYKYSGKLRVLENVLNNDYLWKTIRVKGGAYGGNMYVNKKNMMFYSFRDPKLKETVDAYNGIVNYLKNFNADEKEMTNFIIGAIASMDTPMSAPAKGVMADGLYITGKTTADIQKVRDELLSTTAQDIRECAKLVQEILKQNNICVVGGEEQIQKNKDLFMNVRNVVNK